MRIVDSSRPAFPEVAVIPFARFKDHRGYFTEHYRESDFQGLEPLRGIDFCQMNESFSKAGTIRGLHFQWNPDQGKLVHAVTGHLIDLVMDICKGSPTFGRIIAQDLPARPDDDYSRWIWVPPGFAHGMLLVEETLVEYLCSGEYNPKCEAGISPFSHDLDWSHCDPGLRAIFERVAATTELVSPKDREAPCLSAWADDFRSSHFAHDRACAVRSSDPPSTMVAGPAPAGATVMEDRGSMTSGREPRHAGRDLRSLLRENAALRTEEQSRIKAWIFETSPVTATAISGSMARLRRADGGARPDPRDVRASSAGSSHRSTTRHFLYACDPPAGQPHPGGALGRDL